MVAWSIWVTDKFAPRRICAPIKWYVTRRTPICVRHDTSQRAPQRRVHKPVHTGREWRARHHGEVCNESLRVYVGIVAIPHTPPARTHPTSPFSHSRTHTHLPRLPPTLLPHGCVPCGVTCDRPMVLQRYRRSTWRCACGVCGYCSRLHSHEWVAPALAKPPMSVLPDIVKTPSHVNLVEPTAHHASGVCGWWEAHRVSPNVVLAMVLFVERAHASSGLTLYEHRSSGEQMLHAGSLVV